MSYHNYNFRLPLHQWYFNFFKSIVLCLCLFSVNLSLFADYHWNEPEDYLILNSCVAASIFLNKAIYTDSINTNLVTLSSDINTFDQSVLDNWSPTASKISDYLLTAQVIAPYVISLTSSSDQKKTEMLLYSQAFVINHFLTSSTKFAFKRKRPYVYNQNLSNKQRLDQESQYSFVSGHSSHAFLSALFAYQIMNETQDYKKYKNWINAGLVINAGSIAYLRYHAGKHFPTDILCGSALGAGIGLLIPKLHEKNNDRNTRMIHLSIQF